MRRFHLIAIIAIVVAVLLAAGVFLFHHIVYNNEAAQRERDGAAGPLVRTTTVKRAKPERTLVLTGEARPYTEATLYAKISGYLVEIPVDKGDKVKKDQLLARIQSPESDKDYVGAVADAQNKRAIANRMKRLKEKNLISEQDAKQAQADARVSESHRDQTGALKGYEILRAPFDGVITARFADPGALIQAAAGSQTSSLPIVRLSEVGRLRVYIYLDQKDASYVHVGDAVEIGITENPSLKIPAKVSRIAGELDTNTRMLLTEIDINNEDNALVPGSFVQVSVKAKLPPLLELPVEALVYQRKKKQVAVIENNIVNYRDIVIYSNDGSTMTIASGVKEGDIVALSVGTSLQDKSKVQVAPALR